MADNPYATPFMNPNSARMGLYDMRMMSAANRMETPFERGSHQYRRPLEGGSMLGGLAGMANEPDYTQFTYNPQANAAATAALSHYGIYPLEASQVKNNVLLPNTGFFGAHPRLSGALEGAIFGGAASHGGATPGESIQGALEGMIGSKRIREGMWRQQFARPFEAAGMLEGLEDAAQKRDLQAADIEHLRAVNEHLKNGDEEKLARDTEMNRHNEAIEAWRSQQIEASRPVNVGEGRIGVYHPENMPPFGKPVDPSKPLWEIQQDPEWEKLRNEERINARRASGGLIKGYQTFTDKSGKQQKRYVELSPGQTFPEGFQPINETYQTKEGDKESNQADVKRQAFLQKMYKPSDLMRMGFSSRDGNVMNEGDRQRFLNNYYDQVVMPQSGTGPMNPLETRRPGQQVGPGAMMNTF